MADPEREEYPRRIGRAPPHEPSAHLWRTIGNSHNRARVQRLYCSCGGQESSVPHIHSLEDVGFESFFRTIQTFSPLRAIQTWHCGLKQNASMFNCPMSARNCTPLFPMCKQFLWKPLQKNDLLLSEHEMVLTSPTPEPSRLCRWLCG